MTPRKPRGRIIVINDDRVFLSMMEEFLTDLEGFEVETIREWEGAYELVRSRLPDLVIIDLTLAGEEHGWSIIELLALDPKTANIPLIVCTGATRSLEAYGGKLLERGMAVVTKPFDLDELMICIERQLERHKEDPLTTT